MTRNGILITGIVAGSIALAAVNPLLQPKFWQQTYHHFLSHTHEDGRVLLAAPSADQVGKFDATIDVAVAKAAVYALSNGEHEGALRELSRLLDHPLESEIKKAIVYQIGNHGGAEAVKTLAKVIESDADSNVRKAAVYALGNIGGDEAREILSQVVMSGS